MKRLRIWMDQPSTALSFIHHLLVSWPWGHVDSFNQVVLLSSHGQQQKNLHTQRAVLLNWTCASLCSSCEWLQGLNIVVQSDRKSCSEWQGRDNLVKGWSFWEAKNILLAQFSLTSSRHHLHHLVATATRDYTAIPLGCYTAAEWSFYHFLIVK